eukprot:scaffold5865_cov20-Tisochrysis_lutea.AAC.7
MERRLSHCLGRVHSAHIGGVLEQGHPEVHGDVIGGGDLQQISRHTPSLLVRRQGVLIFRVDQSLWPAH